MAIGNLPELTSHETELLAKAVPFVQEFIVSNQKLPTIEELRKILGCREASATSLRKHIIANKLVDIPPDLKLQEVNEVTENSWRISLPRTRIHTLAQLIEFFEIDEKEWEVERFVANKWEMGYKDEEGLAHTEPLYQVKAFCRRKNYTDHVEAEKAAAKFRSLYERARTDLTTERALSKRLAFNHAGYDDLLANIKEFANALGDLQLPVERIRPAQPLIAPAVRPGHTEDAGLLLSDTHFGDRIRREDTSGFPEYDLTISGNRMGYVVRQAKQVLTLHRAMYPLKRLYVWFGGDIGNGVLHDAPQSNQLFIPGQVHFSYNMLKFAVQDLLTLTEPDENGNVVVEEIVLLFTVGNHMRMDEKMPTKLQAQRTLDWLIYQFLIEKFSGHPKIRIHSEMSPYIFENIRGHRYLFAHGMQVGYRNSPDMQCKSMGAFIDRVRSLFDSPEWRRKNGLQGETFSRVCIGDIHVPVSFPRLLSNGSLNGQNELGVNWVMEPIPAGQQLFGISDAHQETWKYFLDCTHIQKQKDDMNSYGVFAEEYAQRIGR